MFADACSFESSRVKFARMHAFREKFARLSTFIWVNPPYSKNVQTNVARDFQKLIDKHFPAASPFHKIFNRNTVKVSYSCCMNNVKRVISSLNKRVLRETK